jgi:hypothetical protein
MSIIHLISVGEIKIVHEEEKIEIDNNIKYLEYALVYGRYKSLEFLLENKFYEEELQKEEYNPFDLKNCEPDISKDINKGSWWGNDEWERGVYNRTTIDHKKCFQVLKKYNKFLNINNFKKWFFLSNDSKYYNGRYFANINLLTNEIFQTDKEELNISNFIKKFESILNHTSIIKSITKIFNHEDVVNKLR